MNDHRWRVFSPMRANKQCILNSLKTLNAGLNKVSDEDLWNIATSKEVIDDSVKIKCMKRFAAHWGEPDKRIIGPDNSFVKNYQLDVFKVVW